MATTITITLGDDAQVRMSDPRTWEDSEPKPALSEPATVNPGEIMVAVGATVPFGDDMALSLVEDTVRALLTPLVEEYGGTLTYVEVMA